MVVANHTSFLHVSADENKTNLTGTYSEIKDASIELFSWREKGIGDTNVFKTVKIYAEYKLEDPSRPDGNLVTRVRLIGNAAHEGWTGKVRYTIGVPKEYILRPDSIVTVRGNTRKEYADLDEFINTSGTTYADGNRRFSQEYDYYITQFSKGDWSYDKRLEHEYKNGTARILGLKNTGGINNWDSFEIQYEALIPADNRGKDVFVVAAFKKASPVHWQRNVTYKFHILAKPVPPAPEPKDSSYGIVLPQPITLPEGQRYYNITEEQKQNIKNNIVNINRNLNNKVNDQIELEFPTDQFHAMVKVHFQDGSSSQYHYQNFVREVVAKPPIPPGSNETYTGNGGLRYKIRIPDSKKVVSNPNNLTDRETHDVFQALSRANPYTQKNMDQWQQSTFTRDYLISAKFIDDGLGEHDVVLVAPAGSIVTSAYSDEYTGHNEYEFKRIPGNQKIRFYEKTTGTTQEPGSGYEPVLHNYDANRYIDLPVSDLIQNPPKDSGNTNQATDNDKQLAKETIDSFTHLDSAARDEMKQKIQ